jgi:hypothetical protein
VSVGASAGVGVSVGLRVTTGARDGHGEFARMTVLGVWRSWGRNPVHTRAHSGAMRVDYGWPISMETHSFHRDRMTLSVTPNT